MSAAKQYTVGDLFTDEELKRALDLYERIGRNGTFNRVCVRDIVTPEVLARINKTTGQENDRSYLAYVIEFAFSASAGRTRAATQH